jgi:hypothetical protein
MARKPVTDRDKLDEEESIQHSNIGPVAPDSEEDLKVLEDGVVGGPIYDKFEKARQFSRDLDI